LGHPNNSTHLSLNKRRSCASPSNIVRLEEDYWETAKASPSIILKLLFGFLPIPVIRKKNYWEIAGDVLSFYTSHKKDILP